MEAELAAAVYKVIPRKTISEEVLARLAKQQKGSEEWRRQISETALLNRPLNAKQLIADLQRFFAERAYVPDGAAMILAYFTINTWTFYVFDTTPYLVLQSAVVDCGKTTVFRLLESLCPDAHRLTAPTEATLFRLIDAGKPTLLIDEAKILESNSDRADLLRAILDEGYKKGGQVPRCDGENHEIRWFDVFAPKAFAEVGGLSGALLDRSIVVHMERAPHGHTRKSTRVRVLKRDSAPLVEQLKAYPLQAKAELQKLYDAEPDEGYWPQLETREAELYGPLLIHAKLIGPDAERDLVAVVERFSRAKSEIEAEDSNIAKAIAVLECLEEMCRPTFPPDGKFAPVDLLDALLDCEAWALTFGKAKGADEQTRRKGMAAKIGYFLKSFRLEKQKGAHRIKYDLKNAIDVIRRHVPVKPSEPSAAKVSASQTGEDSSTCDSSDSSDSFVGGDWNISSELENHRQNHLANAAATANDTPQDHSTADTERGVQTSFQFGWNGNSDVRNPETAPAAQPETHPAADAEDGEDFFSGRIQ